MPRESKERTPQREDEGQGLSRAAQPSDRDGDRALDEQRREQQHEHDEEREDIEAELEDLQEMEGPDA